MMGNQKTPTVSSRHDDLASELRGLRHRSGLTLAALAQRTSYSKSSWERYLNGKSLPPESALRAFADAVGVKPARLLVLRSLVDKGEASAVGTRVEAPEPRTPAPEVPSAAPDSAKDGNPAPAPVPSGSRRHLVASALFTTFALLIGILTGVGITALLDDGAERAKAPDVHAQQSPQGKTVRCIGFECDGKDPERHGCTEKAWTAAQRLVGTTYVELRYSPTCQAAWGRIVHADVGDVARVEGPKGHTAQRPLSYGHDVYTPMVDAPYPAAARACAELTSGENVCTAKGAASPAPYTTARPTGS